MMMTIINSDGTKMVRVESDDIFGVVTERTSEAGAYPVLYNVYLDYMENVYKILANGDILKIPQRKREILDEQCTESRMRKYAPRVAYAIKSNAANCHCGSYDVERCIK